MSSQSSNLTDLEAEPATLYTRLPIRNFQKSQIAELKEALDQVDTGVAIVPCPPLSELRLLPTGFTEEGDYRYTLAGFNNLCQLLSHGITAFLPDIGGMVGRQAHDPELTDMQAAIGIFNLVLALRYSLLRDKQFVLNTTTRTIDGVVGSQHRIFRNFMLFELAEQSAPASPIPEQFYGATLSGRRCTLFYRSLHPAFALRRSEEDPHRFWYGHYLCSGESAKMPVRATCALYGPYGTALGSFGDGGTIRHAGQNFERRVSRMIARAFCREPNLGELQRGIERLAATSLQLDAPEAERNQRLEQIRRGFLRRKVVLRVADTVLDNAVWVGAAKQPTPSHLLDPLDPYAMCAKRRTAYDLFCAMVRQSRKLNQARREQLEQLAHDLTMNRFRLFP